MLGAAGLEHELDDGLAHVQIEALAHVLDVERLAPSSPTSASTRASEPGRSGIVAGSDQPAPGLALVAASDLSQQPGVDVATGEDGDRRPGDFSGDVAGQQGAPRRRLPRPR